jgi:hypothetical protein
MLDACPQKRPSEDGLSRCDRNGHAVLGLHDFRTCATLCDRAFATRGFRGAVFRGSHSAASAFFSHRINSGFQL